MCRPCLFIAFGLIVGGIASTCGAADKASLEVGKIYFEYNATDKDLGVHVSIDGEDWRTLRIVDPKKHVIFNVAGRGGYKKVGLTELFFEGAEPELAHFPLDKLLALFPAGRYEFKGTTVEGGRIGGMGMLSHAIPDGPSVAATVGPGDSVVISWSAVTGPPKGFPDEPLEIAGYQVIVGESFQVIVPAQTTMVTVSPEVVASLASGEQRFEVLAIATNGNQTLTVGSFTKP